jgi:hypothetical protein
MLKKESNAKKPAAVRPSRKNAEEIVGSTIG